MITFIICGIISFVVLVIGRFMYVKYLMNKYSDLIELQMLLIIHQYLEGKINEKEVEDTAQKIFYETMGGWHAEFRKNLVEQLLKHLPAAASVKDQLDIMLQQLEQLEQLEKHQITKK